MGPQPGLNTALWCSTVPASSCQHPVCYTSVPGSSCCVSVGLSWSLTWRSLGAKSTLTFRGSSEQSSVRHSYAPPGSPRVATQWFHEARVMSTAVSDAGGVVVISHVRSQNDQGNGPEEGDTCDAPAGMPKIVHTFYSGEPEVLGTTQIFTGIILMSLDIIITIAITNNFNYVGFLVYSGAPLWTGILFIISGSLSVAASVKPTIGKVKSSLVMNIFSSLAAFCGMIMAAMEVSMLPHFTPYVLHDLYCAYYKSDIQCIGAFSAMDVYYGFLSFNLILFVLMICISISTSVFGCRTVCRSSFQEVNVVIYQTTSSIVSDPSRDVPLTPQQLSHLS